MMTLLRRTAPVMATAVLLLFGMASGPASATVSTPTSIVFDPGPKNRCFYTEREFYAPITAAANQTPYYDDSGCAADDDPMRDDHKCLNDGSFPYVGPQGGACPAWDFITMNWQSSQYEQYPGYDTQVWGTNGSPLTLVLQSNTEPLGANNDCNLRETTAAYQYPESGLRRKPDWTAYSVADGDLTVSYDAWAQQSGGFTCSEKRAIMTTDLLFWDDAHSRNDVISVVNYDPGHFAGTPNADNVLWQNNCAGSSCRVTVLGQQIPAGSTTHLTIDFGALLQQLGNKYLGGLTQLDTGMQINAIQFVNSTRGADLQTRVSNADVVLQPGS